MLFSLEKQRDIAAAQRQLESKLKSFRHRSVDAVVGYRGGNFETRVFWLTDLHFWCTFVKPAQLQSPRHWNAFGLTEPKPNANLSMTCQINFPLKRTDKRVGALFARDDYGNVVIAHRGKIGGGKTRIGKSLFVNSYRGDWETLFENGRQTPVALIASLSSPRLVQQIRDFVFQVQNIKDSVERPHDSPNSVSFQPNFSEEFSGKKRYIATSTVEAKCDHGLIVNALAELLRQKNARIGNDRNRDLFVLDDDRNIRTLFEVKTDVASQTIYSAIGQLYFNGSGLSLQPKLVMVLPYKPNRETLDILSALSIEVLPYKLGGGNVTVPSIDRFIP